MHARRPMRVPQRQGRGSVRAGHAASGRQQWLLSPRAVPVPRGHLSAASAVPQVPRPEDY